MTAATHSFIHSLTHSFISSQGRKTWSYQRELAITHKAWSSLSGFWELSQEKKNKNQVLVSFLCNVLFGFRWNATSKKSLFPFSCLCSLWAFWQPDKIVTENKCCRAKSRLQLNSTLGVPESCWDTKRSWSTMQPGWCSHPSFPRYFPEDTCFRFLHRTETSAVFRRAGEQETSSEWRWFHQSFPRVPGNPVTVCGVGTAVVIQVHI